MSTHLHKRPCGAWPWLALGVFTLLTAGPVQAQAIGPSVYEARVTRVFDGDTLWVQPLAGGRYRKLRLDGLDAPEICQNGGEASRDVLAARVLRQVVTVRERSHDDYGRALVRLQHGGEDVGALMVLQGQAWSYRWRHSEGPFVQEEAQARAQKKGLFAADSPELPRDFRRRHGPCPLPPRP
jgi:micrococcal nuclease